MQITGAVSGDGCTSDICALQECQLDPKDVDVLAGTVRLMTVQRSAKVDASGCVNASGKPGRSNMLQH